MTLVIGLKDKGKVWFGADSFSSSSFYGINTTINKVFKSKGCDRLMIGICGSHRQADILEFNELIDKVDVLENKNIDRGYMVTKVVPKVSSLFKAGGCEGVDSGEVYGGTFLFAVNDDLFKMQSDYSIITSKNDYMCIGSGMYHADGSMETTKDMDMSPQDRIRLALESTEHHQLNVRRPFVIMNNVDDEVIIID